MFNEAQFLYLAMDDCIRMFIPLTSDEKHEIVHEYDTRLVRNCVRNIYFSLEAVL